MSRDNIRHRSKSSLRFFRLYQYVKDRARRADSQACLNYSEPQPMFEAKPQRSRLFYPLWGGQEGVSFISFLSHRGTGPVYPLLFYSVSSIWNAIAQRFLIFTKISTTLPQHERNADG